MATERPSDVAGDSDEGLWHAFVGGDDEAVERLAERYRDDLYWYLFLSTGDQQAAAQHLLRVWELVAKYRRPLEGFDSFRHWVYAVATQNAVPATRPDTVGLGDLLDELKRSREVSQQAGVFYALRDLLRPVRQPFLLVAVAGLTIEQAARACNFREERIIKSIDQAIAQLAPLAAFEPGAR